MPTQRSGEDGGSGKTPDVSADEERAGLSDADLVARMREGDGQAYGELYRRHAEAVRRYAHTCCRDADTADDLTNEVFARTLLAVRGGRGPRTAVRAYLLTAVRHAAAHWARTTRREELVEDFAAFAVAAAGGRAAAADETLAFGADVQAMQEAEQSLVVRAFRALPERWQTVLWHTTVEESPPHEVAPLLGLTPNATAVLAHRAREGLRQAYLQAHVSESLTAGGACARYADRLGAYARGTLRTRAERGLRSHLESCARCRTAAQEVKDVNARLRGLLPVAVIGWFAAEYAARAAGGAGAAGALASAAGAGSAGAGGAGAGGGSAAAEGLGAPARAGIAAGALSAAAAAVLLVLALAGAPQPKESSPPQALPSPAASARERPQAPQPSEPGLVPPAPSPPTTPPAPAEPTRGTAPSRVAAALPPATPSGPPPSAPRRGPSSSPPPPEPSPPVPTAPAPVPAPGPGPATYQVRELPFDVVGDGTGPAVRVGESGPVWQRSGLRVGGRSYRHGITVQAPSTVLIDLNRECAAYEAVAGVDDLTLGLGAARFTVLGDGRQLWRSGVVRGGEPPVPVSVPLAGVRVLHLVVEPHGPYGPVTQADWAHSVLRCR